MTTKALLHLTSDLPNPAQDLTRNAIILHDSLPVPEPAHLPLNHEGPNPVCGLVQQGMAALVSMWSFHPSVEGPQCCKSLLDLAAQGSQRLRFLLTELVIEHAPAGFRLEAR